MKNTIISLILFLIVMCFMFFASHEVNSLCSEIINETNELEVLLDKNDINAAYESSIELLNLLKEEGFITSIYLNHIDIDSIIDEAVKLTVLIKTDDMSSSLASLHLIKYNAQRIQKLQKPTLGNIL